MVTTTPGSTPRFTTWPGPPNHVSVQPPRSQIRTGAVASITTAAARKLGSDRRPEVPLAGDPLQHLGAAVVEAEVRTDDEVLDRARDEHLARPGQRADSRADVDADAGDIVAAALDLAGVQPG